MSNNFNDETMTPGTNPSDQNNSESEDAKAKDSSANKDKRSKRRLARIGALELLFAMSFNKYSLSQCVEMLAFIEDEDTPPCTITQFTVDLVAQTLTNIKQIDENLRNVIKNWRPERLSIVDRTLLRLGSAEIFFFNDIPPKVTINEYIEIAKDYSDDDAPGFINGILDKLARTNSKLK